MEHVELHSIEWFKKVNERMRMFLYKVDSGDNNISDEDREMMGTIWKRLNVTGHLLFYKPAKEENDEVAEQLGLFAQESHKIMDGTVLDKDTVLTNKIKKQ